MAFFFNFRLSLQTSSSVENLLFLPTKDSTMLAIIYRDILMMWHDTDLWTMIHRSEIPRGKRFANMNVCVLMISPIQINSASSYHNRHKHMRTANMETAKLDGVNSIKYHVKEMERKNTFTRIVVELNPAEVSPSSIVCSKFSKLNFNSGPNLKCSFCRCCYS